METPHGQERGGGGMKERGGGGMKERGGGGMKERGGGGTQRADAVLVELVVL